MGLLDQVIGSVTGGKDGHTSPLTKALLLMLAAKAATSYFGRHDAPASAAPAGGAGTPAPAPSGNIESGILAGLPSLDSLLGSLRSGGHDEKVDSWIGKGENKEVAPQELGGALGQQALDQLSQATGMSKDDLLKALAGVLPQVVDKLSPDGKLPDEKNRGHW